MPLRLRDCPFPFLEFAFSSSPNIIIAVASVGGDPAHSPMAHWTPEGSEDIMKKTDTAVAMLSVSAPGAALLKGPPAAKLAREVNIYGAKLREDRPHFGFFCSVPDLFETEACLNEINFAFDELKADGIILFTRYGEGDSYLGAKAFLPIWKELNRRKAVVFIHPTHPVDTNFINEKLPPPMVTYPSETTYTASDMLVAGTKHDYPDCKVILSHAGGTLPYLVQRLAILGSDLNPDFPPPEQIIADAKSFYYDTALSGCTNVLDTLLNFAPHDHILYGSDYPYAGHSIVIFDRALEDYPMPDKLRKMIYYENAYKLFPRLAKK